MKLKSNILKEIKKNKKCVRALEDLHNRAPYTIQTWLKNNHPLLCHIDSLNIISKYLDKDISELISNDKNI